MLETNDTPVLASDKDVLMEVRGIIDGCIDSGCKEYAEALKEIHCKIEAHRGYADHVVVLKSDINGGIVCAI